MRSLKGKILNSDKESAAFTLTSQDLDKILFSLAFTAGWSSEVNSNDMKEYKKLWDKLNKGAKKSFDEDIYVDDWTDYEMSHTGSFKRLR